MRLSIIIPVYNVEQYVERCILSCVCQNISTSDYEIIVINDGSIDHSPDVIKKLTNTYSNIRYLTQENKGLSSTRNRGLQLARGEIVWFVDSDDWIEDNCLSSLLNTIEDADVLICTRMYAEGIWKRPPYFIPDYINNLEGWFFCNSPSPVQFYLFKREFLMEYGLKFVEGRKHEDALFTPITLCKAAKIKFYRNPVYHFFKHEGSISTTIDKNRVYDYKFVISELVKYYQSGCPENLKNGLANRIAGGIVAHLQLAIMCGHDVYDDTNCYYTQNKDILNLLKYSMKKNTRVLSYCIKISPFSIMTTYRILSRIRYSI